MLPLINHDIFGKYYLFIHINKIIYNFIISNFVILLIDFFITNIALSERNA